LITSQKLLPDEGHESHRVQVFAPGSIEHADNLREFPFVSRDTQTTNTSARIAPATTAWVMSDGRAKVTMTVGITPRIGRYGITPPGTYRPSGNLSTKRPSASSSRSFFQRQTTRDLNTHITATHPAKVGEREPDLRPVVDVVAWVE